MLRLLISTLFLDVLRRMFMKESGVIIYKLSEEDLYSPVWEGGRESIKNPNITRR